jgi:hypothetical protein
MALFGDVGKFLGLGTARETAAGAAQGALRGAIMGQPFMGAGVGAATAGTQQGQATARDVPSGPPLETSTSGSTDRQNLYAPATAPQPSPFVQNIAFGPSASRAIQPIQRSQSMMAQPALLPLGPAIAGGAAMAAPFIIDAFTGEQKKLVVTRSLKSKVKRAVDLIGIEATADGMGVDQDIVVYILMKKLRNDGAYVTKAAMRKTSSTLRKMKRMCDMYDDLRPAAKRRAPVRKSSSIMQVKN